MPGGADANDGASEREVDPLDQELDDACLLGREELVPEGIEARSVCATSASVMPAPGPFAARPGPRHDLRRTQQIARPGR